DTGADTGDGGAPDDDRDGDGSPVGLDCDDGDRNAAPGLVESCDGADNDCDGETDEADAVDARTWYADADGDEYGDPATPVLACDPPEGTNPDPDDCDDGDASVHPGAEEVWYDGVDQDCDGNDDDQDRDGYPAGDDCDDLDATRIRCPEESRIHSEPQDDGGCDHAGARVAWLGLVAAAATRRRRGG
ncbi:MAG: putative metal-binding motif-containing protein, partial [Myxococcota bacterium]